ncbi:hypothetical protein VTN77DRAFT_3553 [Rasamsonia byssochlamydoides]|uniref:uncharacterized protein n=1 Tax=Rasamsonia byssochlamydoides TaxID=89139 RepID=UPI003744A874
MPSSSIGFQLSSLTCETESERVTICTPCYQHLLREKDGEKSPPIHTLYFLLGRLSQGLLLLSTDLQACAVCTAAPGCWACLIHLE